MKWVSLVLAPFLATSVAFGDWQLPFDQINVASQYDSELSTLASGSTVHVSWSSSGRSDLRGFDAAGNQRYAIDFSVAPFSAGGAVAMSHIAGSTSILVRAGGVLAKIAEDGALLWRLSGAPTSDDVADAYEYSDGTTVIALSPRSYVNSRTTLARVSSAGVVEDARFIGSAYGSSRGKFDGTGRLMVQTGQFVLSRFDGRTMEETSAWTRVDADVRAISAARDGGSAVLTASALIKLSPAGAILWSAPINGIRASSGTEYRLIETASGAWLAYEYDSQRQVTGVSASGVVNFSRPTDSAEFGTLSDDGAAFARSPTVLELNPADGSTRDVASFVFSNLGRVAALGSIWVIPGFNGTTDLRPPTVGGISHAGDLLWLRGTFSQTSITNAPRPDARLMCFGQNVVATTEGLAAMVVAGRIDIANLDASYLNFVSSTGQLLTSTPLSSSQCMPALDTSMTRYEADATTYRVRATRRDGTVAWQTSVPEYFIGTSSTMLLGNTTVAATLFATIVGFDKTTGTQQWTVRASPVAAVALQAADALWAVTSTLGLIRVSSNGTYLTVASSLTSLQAGASTMLALRDGGLLIVSNSIATRYDADGTQRWSAAINASGISIGRVRRALELANGDIAISGCDNSFAYGFQGFFARYSVAGALQHRKTFSTATASCVDALAEQPTGELIAALQINGSSALRLFSPAGNEVARFDGLWPDAPSTAFSDLLVRGNSVVTFGSATSIQNGIQIASLASIDGVVPHGAQLRFLSNPPPAARYDQPFAVVVGIADTASNPVLATTPIVVTLARAATSAAGTNSSTCTIAAGADRCTVSGLRGYPIRVNIPTLPPQTYSSAALDASANGFLPVQSAAFAVSAAPTTVTITVRSPSPFRALTDVRYQVDVSASMAPGLRDARPASGDCVAVPSGVGILRYQCTNKLTAPTTSLAFAYDGGSGAYQSSSTSQSVATQKSPLEIRPLPSNPTTVRAGEPFFMSAWFLLPNGLDLWPAFSNGVLTNSVSTVLCPDMPVGSNSGNTPTSPHGCSTRETRVGNDPLTLSVGETAQTQLSSRSIPLTVTAASGVQGDIYVQAGTPMPTICGTSAGLVCTFTRPFDTQVRYKCDAPNGWQGGIYVQQPGYRFTANGRSFGPLTAIEPSAVTPYAVAATACSLDVNGDARMDVESDGLFVLKSLFGMAGQSDYAPLAHACASATYADAQARIRQAIANLDWDLDGDGKVLPLTDGLLLLRMMLGLYGDALLRGAVNPAGLRTDEYQITSYFYNRCGSP